MENEKTDVLQNVPKNEDIFNSFVVTKSKLDNPNYENIMCSISGGADSDILIDIIAKLNALDKVHFVWFDTGLEYQATKDHLKYLEDKYGIEVEIRKAVKPIPNTCKEYGQPFLSKQVSEFINRLQKHNFKWEDRPFEELYKEYPNCKAALLWWCNGKGEGSRFNIDYNKYLKEFLLENPPTDIKISSVCCKNAKKTPALNYKKENNIDLSIIGVRKAEGGVRSSAYKNCFTTYEDKTDEFRPIFWYKDSTRKEYEDFYNVEHSQCYSEYGLKRTGCAGCPYGRDFEEELKVMEEHEPKLYKAVCNIFGESYEYTRKYKEFVKAKKEKMGDEA